MRSNVKIRSVQATADTALVTVAETVIATLPGVSNQSADGIIRFMGYAVVTGGANTTFVTLRVRRASLVGTLIGEGDPATLTGAAIASVPIYAEDTPGEVGGVTYVLTAQLTAASANGSVQIASLLALS